MTEENQEAVETEIIDTPEPETVEIETDGEEAPSSEETPKAEEKKAFDPKRDKVEFDKPEQQARFNEVFRQLKKSDQRNEMLTGLLKEYVQVLDDFKGERAQVKAAEAEKTLMSNLIAAKESGDDEAYAAALSKLVEFNSSKHAEKIEQKVNGHLQKSATDEQQNAQYVTSLMEETDDSGNYIRPWLQEDHPQFGAALYKMAAIAKKYEGKPDQLQKTLSELDTVMGNSMTQKEPTKEAPAQSRAPHPMQGSNLTNHKPKGTIKMTRTEADILKKLERHSGKKIDPKKYAARRDAMQQKKGGR